MSQDARDQSNGMDFTNQAGEWMASMIPARQWKSGASPPTSQSGFENDHNGVKSGLRDTV
jgi:hypothetical protein